MATAPRKTGKTAAKAAGAVAAPRKPGESASSTPRKPGESASGTPRKPGESASGTPRKPGESAPSTPRKPGVRELAAQATRDAILRAATKVFAKHGFDGGRVEQISKAAKSYDRMIYYYFGSKEGLFIAVIEDTYRRFNEAEQALVLDVSQPVEALKTVIRFVWHYYQKNPEFITLLNTENLYRGKHIGRSSKAREYSSPVIAITQSVLASGAQQGVFRADLSARDLYLMVAAMAYFYLSNRFTLSAFLGEDLEAAPALAHWEAFLIDSVLRTVRA